MQRKLRILVVEDEAAIRAGLVDVFVYHGYDVEGVGDGREGLERALAGHFDLVLLDVMLPGMNGFEICDQIREIDRDQPIIMLTAKTTTRTSSTGWRSAPTTTSRSRSPSPSSCCVCRRCCAARKAARPPPRTSSSPATSRSTRATCRGRRGAETLAFTRREIEILQYLERIAERPVSRDELLAKVWGYDRSAEIETRTVDIHIAKLRRKIEDDPGAAQPADRARRRVPARGEPEAQPRSRRAPLQLAACALLRRAGRAGRRS